MISWINRNENVVSFMYWAKCFLSTLCAVLKLYEGMAVDTWWGMWTLMWWVRISIQAGNSQWTVSPSLACESVHSDSGRKGRCGSVVDHRHGAHPEMEDEPRDSIELNYSPNAGEVQHSWEKRSWKCVNTPQTQLDFGSLLRCKMFQRKVFHDQVTDWCQIPGRTFDGPHNEFLEFRGTAVVLFLKWLPCVVDFQFVGVVVVDIVLDSPRLKRVDQRRHYRKTNEIV